MAGLQEVQRRRVTGTEALEEVAAVFGGDFLFLKGFGAGVESETLTGRVPNERRTDSPITMLAEMPAWEGSRRQLHREQDFRYSVGALVGAFAVRSGLDTDELYDQFVAQAPEEAPRREVRDVDQSVRENSLEFLAFEKGIYDIYDRLREVGWVYAGGENTQRRTIKIGLSLPDHLAHRGEVVFLELPIRDDDSALYPGYELERDEKTGEARMGYEGPLDERFKQVVDAMVEIAKPPETELDTQN